MPELVVCVSEVIYWGKQLPRYSPRCCYSARAYRAEIQRERGAAISPNICGIKAGFTPRFVLGNTRAETHHIQMIN